MLSFKQHPRRVLLDNSSELYEKLLGLLEETDAVVVGKWDNDTEVEKYLREGSLETDFQATKVLCISHNERKKMLIFMRVEV